MLRDRAQREKQVRRRVVRQIFRSLRTGDLPKIIVKRIPPLSLGWPPWHYGDYSRDDDRLRAWVGGDFEDTAWHEAVHAAEARLGLKHDERRARVLAAHLTARYELPDLTLEYACPTCEAGVYFGRERCGCGEELSWPRRIPRRRRHSR